MIVTIYPPIRRTVPDQESPTMPRFASLGCVLIGLLTVNGTAFADATLAKGGKPTVVIVTPEDVIPAEETAALELAEYLKKATGGEFAMAAEPEHDPAQPAIYIGPTEFAKHHGLDAASWGPERWAMQSAGDSLILVGGQTRGTLYAVYHFLEDVVGVPLVEPRRGTRTRPSYAGD
jgi:hypothetical protein